MRRLDARNKSTNTRHSVKGTGLLHSKHDCATGNNDTRRQYWWIDVIPQGKTFMEQINQ